MALTVLIIQIQGCATQNISQYQNKQPKLVLIDFFNGEIEGWGMFQDRKGQVKRQFHVKILATQKNSKHITLYETFSWADKTKTRRIWQLKQTTDGSWKGTANDVIGEASGTVAGNALHWKYQLKLPVQNKVYTVTFDDWMYLISPKVMLNRSVMSKYGVELGSVTLSLHKK